MMITLLCAMFTFMLMPGLTQQGRMKKNAANQGKEPPDANQEAAYGKGNQYALPELVTNVGESAGRRFVVANLTLVGAPKAFVEQNQAKIMDLTSGILARLNPALLETPAQRKMVKTELLAELQRVLGGPYIKDIYFTRLAIQ